MLVTINKRPIKVVEESQDEKCFSWIYTSVSSIGFILILWIMDLVCYTFFYIHPLPFIVWVGDLIQWLF